MNFVDLRKTLEETFETGWGVITPISWENAPIKNQPQETDWVRATVRTRNSLNVVLGEGEPSRLNGFFSVQIFVPLGEGLGNAWGYVDSVNGIMENQQFPGTIFTYASQVVNVGEGQRRVKDLEVGFYQINVNIPYEAQ